ncbi:unnamed protein product [Rhizophagus irregularis]|nr:unnamed protein product [Rhizophagus irregularis]CAB5374981.1 unnamed protein product [Rhizophagus irregularis]
MVSVLAVDWRLGMNWYRSLRFLGQLLSFYSVHPTCNTIRGSRIGYIGFRRTQNLDSEFFLVDLFNYGFGFEFSFCRCNEFSADWNFFISDLNLDFLLVRRIWNNWTCFLVQT